MHPISDKRRFFEIAASILTGLAKILFVDVLHQKLIFIIIACLFWIGYLIRRYRQDKQVLVYWGFTKSNFWKSFKRLALYVSLSVLAFLAYGLYFNVLIFNWHIIPILLIYPLWGVIQQYLVMSLVAGNLKDQDKFKISNFWIILLTASLFAIIHYPEKLLIGGTFLLALVYASEYLREKNLWVLGIYHGWLGCLYYFFVLGRDPWLEVFGALF